MGVDNGRVACICGGNLFRWGNVIVCIVLTARGGQTNPLFFPEEMREIDLRCGDGWLSITLH